MHSTHLGGPLPDRVVTVGVDDGPASRSAAQAGARLADATGAHLLLVHAWTSRGPDPSESARSREVADEMTRTVLEELELPVGLTASTWVERGSAGAVLTRLSHHSQVLLVGRRESLPRRIVDGSVAAEVCRRASCPVLTVPPSWDDRSRRSADERHRVVVAVAEHGDLVPLVRFGLEQADAVDADLVVIHALVVPSDSADLDADAGDLEALVRPVLDERPDVPSLVLPMSGTPREALLQASRWADLLVVGRPTPQGSWPSWMLSVAHAVVGRSHCPVALVPVERAGRHARPIQVPAATR